MRRILVVTTEDIMEILDNPSKFVNTTYDKVLVKIHDDEDDYRWMIMIGQNERSGEYYLVVEDDEMSEDYYPSDYGVTLEELFNKILDK